MQVIILGNNAALPTHDRHPTSQAVMIEQEYFLLDCGEGTQLQMQRYKIKWRKINHIFISHLHGDHYFGLPGLLNSMSLLKRTSPLHLYAPKALEDILKLIFEAADTQLHFPLHFHPLPEPNGLYTLADYPAFSVACFPVEHRITCHGFLFTQKQKPRKILPDQCKEYQIPYSYFQDLKEGKDYVNGDQIIANELLTTDGDKEKKYAYCADTRFQPEIVNYIKGTDTIYHESTFLEENADKAYSRFHSTAREAARIALLANAQQLLLGHYSSKYKNTILFEEEARTLFPNSIATKEGSLYEV